MRTPTHLVLCLAACGGGHAKSSNPTTASSRDTACPPAITAAITKAHPELTQQSCKGEMEDGKQEYEAKVTKPDGSVAEVVVAADGAILAMEEVIQAAALPAAVSQAFAAKYPNAQTKRVEKMTPTGKPPMFEIAFSLASQDKEATFSEAGDFVEEETRKAGEKSED